MDKNYKTETVIDRKNSWFPEERKVEREKKQMSE